MTVTNGNDKTISLQIADVTIQAVDKIGEHAAGEIEKAAGDIRNTAENVARELEELAHAIREHTIKASEQVAVFVQKTTHTVGIVKELQERINGGMDGSKPRSSGSDSKDTAETSRQGASQKTSAGSAQQRQGQSKSNSDPVPGSSAS